MAIYLDEQTRPYLERLVKNIKETDFIGKRVQKMLEADRERLNLLGSCDRVEGSYTGHKECCAKCGAFYKTGMGESWILEEKKAQE